MDRYRALETFIAVAESGSLAGAGRTLGLSAPSVTRIINELEDALGVTLLHRTTRIVTLTEAGAAYLTDARRIVEEMQAADDAARGAHRAPSGLLRLTAPVLFGQHYISPILLDYLNQYKDVTAEAVYLDRVASIIEEGFDVALRIGPLPDSSLRAVRVGEVRRVICGCPSYFERHGLPQRPADLADHNIIAVRSVSASNKWSFAGGESVEVTPRLTYASVPAAIAAAKTGWGLTRVLSYQIGPDLDAGGLKTVLSEFEPDPLPIHLIHAEGMRASAKVRAFVDMAASRLRADPHLS
ncbi:LysR family transcriptional regulator [Parvularcula marina]|uniref:LysR family transcriptional regulator n=1 Tax=Parvularcula marina TaxID=2292771 RepID=A0A371R8F8_9PROT|nr:LysR family transcriptional regulator [Parvularcula marina]RFB01719.1 LysR family transcriptional regulator [Parvularcula marina]